MGRVSYPQLANTVIVSHISTSSYRIQHTERVFLQKTDTNLPNIDSAGPVLSLTYFVFVIRYFKEYPIITIFTINDKGSKRRMFWFFCAYFYTVIVHNQRNTIHG